MSGRSAFWLPIWVGSIELSLPADGGVLYAMIACYGLRRAFPAPAWSTMVMVLQAVGLACRSHCHPAAHSTGTGTVRTAVNVRR